jgi:hypothetical protein
MVAPSVNPRRDAVTTGIKAGLIGGVVIWIYEAVVWVGVQHMMPLTGIMRNATGLVFGKALQEALGSLSYGLGIAIHFGFAAVWGVLFALAWPGLRQRGWEASLAALLLAPVLWVVMHVAIALAGHEHPNYLDPQVIIGGIMSHIFFTVPMALFVKRAKL